ncbi:unnamed protein product [Vitrella brassicaformis CCMP3155]|uniref:Peptidase M14 domain-containing protein n=2 Tax=Vitrella brassicaformis TaxID=1169539 RepID=A0A0G4F232_VITBC|nr:unnamed protein product [Vitrella brassicaformis CCMP3155]|eukprot:CEM05679.1 unnamed protein product [Vitrella brassicaformis CCMP3155]
MILGPGTHLRNMILAEEGKQRTPAWSSACGICDASARVGVSGGRMLETASESQPLSCMEDSSNDSPIIPFGRSLPEEAELRDRHPHPVAEPVSLAKVADGVEGDAEYERWSEGSDNEGWEEEDEGEEEDVANWRKDKGLSGKAFLDSVKGEIAVYLAAWEESRRQIVYDRHHVDEYHRWQSAIRAIVNLSIHHQHKTPSTKEKPPLLNMTQYPPNPNKLYLKPLHPSPWCPPAAQEGVVGQPSGQGRAGSLCFSAAFENGNLLIATAVSAHVYKLLLEPDTNSIGHTQWFYWCVAGGTKGVTYTFQIENCAKPNSLYSQGMRPVSWSTKAGRGWERAGRNIRYSRGTLLRPNDRGYFSVLSFEYDWEHEDDTVFFAYHYPYTYSLLQDFLDALEENPHSAALLRRHTLCQSIAGLRVDMLEVHEMASAPPTPCTEPAHPRGSTPNTSRPLSAMSERPLSKSVPPDKGRGKREGSSSPEPAPPELRLLRSRKPVVVLIARLHPGEPQGSWMIHGFIRFLVGDSPHAILLRRAYHFVVVPMMNPDGVIYGNYRCSLAGVDLNRVFASPKEFLHPSVFHLKKLLRQLHDQGREILAFFDFHGHSKRKGIFLYGCRYKPPSRPGSPSARMAEEPLSLFGLPGSNPVADNVEIRLLARLCCLGGFDLVWTGCKFGMPPSKLGTARCVIFKEFRCKFCYAIEASCWTADRRVPLPPKPAWSDLCLKYERRLRRELENRQPRTQTEKAMKAAAVHALTPFEIEARERGWTRLQGGMLPNVIDPPPRREGATMTMPAQKHAHFQDIQALISATAAAAEGADHQVEAPVRGPEGARHQFARGASRYGALNPAQNIDLKIESLQWVSNHPEQEQEWVAPSSERQGNASSLQYELTPGRLQCVGPLVARALAKIKGYFPEAQRMQNAIEDARKLQNEEKQFQHLVKKVLLHRATTEHFSAPAPALHDQSLARAAVPSHLPTLFSTWDAFDIHENFDGSEHYFPFLAYGHMADANLYQLRRDFQAQVAAELEGVAPKHRLSRLMSRASQAFIEPDDEGSDSNPSEDNKDAETLSRLHENISRKVKKRKRLPDILDYSVAGGHPIFDQLQQEQQDPEDIKTFHAFGRTMIVKVTKDAHRTTPKADTEIRLPSRPRTALAGERPTASLPRERLLPDAADDDDEVLMLKDAVSSWEGPGPRPVTAGQERGPRGSSRLVSPSDRSTPIRIRLSARSARPRPEGRGKGGERAGEALTKRRRELETRRASVNVSPRKFEWPGSFRQAAPAPQVDLTMPFDATLLKAASPSSSPRVSPRPKHMSFRHRRMVKGHITSGSFGSGSERSPILLRRPSGIADIRDPAGGREEKTEMGLFPHPNLSRGLTRPITLQSTVPATSPSSPSPPSQPPSSPVPPQSTPAKKGSPRSSPPMQRSASPHRTLRHRPVSPIAAFFFARRARGPHASLRESPSCSPPGTPVCLSRPGSPLLRRKEEDEDVGISPAFLPSAPPLSRQSRPSTARSVGLNRDDESNAITAIIPGPFTWRGQGDDEKGSERLLEHLGIKECGTARELIRPPRTRHLARILFPPPLVRKREREAEDSQPHDATVPDPARPVSAPSAHHSTWTRQSPAIGDGSRRDDSRRVGGPMDLPAMRRVVMGGMGGWTQVVKG